MKELSKLDLEYINRNHSQTKVSEKEVRSKHHLNTLLKVVFSILIFCTGLSLIFTVGTVYNSYILATVGIVIAVTALYLYFFASITTSKALDAFALILLGSVGIALIYFAPIPVAFLFRLTTSIMGLVVSAFLYINVWRLHLVKAPFARPLLLAIVYTVLSLMILFGPYSSLIFTLFIGCYLIWFSISTLYETVYEYKKTGTINNSFMNSVPSILSFFVPIAIYKKLNTIIREEPDEILDSQERDKDFEPDLVAYIHVRPGLLPGFGHVDLCFDGKVYSFGDYNNKVSQRMGTLVSDGVLATLDPIMHINFELKDCRKMLIGYGFKLTPEQKQKVQEKLDEILSQTTEWNPVVHDKEGNIIAVDPDHYIDDGSRIFLKSIAHFRMFNEGSPYRLYYGVGENCSKFVNDVIGATGAKLSTFSHIITPGNYLAYLDKLYHMDNSIVKERRLYSLNSEGVPLEYPDKFGKAFKLENVEVSF